MFHFDNGGGSYEHMNPIQFLHLSAVLMLGALYFFVAFLVVVPALIFGAEMA